MRILVDGMPRTMGGIGTLLLNIIDCNEKIGNRQACQFEFLVPEKSTYVTVLKQKGYCYYEVPKFYTHKYKGIVKRIFKQKKYDFIWINNTSKINIFLLKIAKRNQCKIIVHSHGVATEARGLKKVVFSLIEKVQGEKYCKMSDIQLACSNASADYFYPVDMRCRCKIMINGLEVSKFIFNEDDRNFIRDKLSIKENEILLGAVGRLTKVKNYEFIIALMEKLPNEYKLIVLGEGEQEKELLMDIDKRDLSNRVKLLGKVKEVEKYMSAMDAFLMPSLNEGMPFALIEAQANGLKCIVSTGVSSESKIIDCVEYVDLKDSKTWIEELKRTDNSTDTRLKNGNQVINSKYNIEQSYKLFMECMKDTGGNNENKN